jgi:hypothetical protein
MMLVLLFGSLKVMQSAILTGKLDATPIYFKDKFQNISSGKLNNTGKTLRGIGSDLASGNINVGANAGRKRMLLSAKY